MSDEMAKGTRRIRDLGPLHELLLRAAPTAAEVQIKGRNPDRRSITTLAKALNLRTWSIYLWIRTGKIPPAKAKQIVDGAQGRVTLDEFHPFVYS